MEWRTGKQCRERYINQLDPNIKKTPWTIEEDTTIKRLHDQLGKKWSKFMDYLPGRSDNAIKNRWHVISRDNFPEQTSPAIPALDTHAATTIKLEHKNIVRTKKSLKAACAARELKEEGEEPCQHHSSAEDAEVALGCELLGLPLDSGDIDFDLCSFVAEDAYDGTHYDCEDNNSTASSSYTPRTTNDSNELGEGAEERSGSGTGTGMGASLEYTYSKTNSVASSTGDTSGRSSPFDAQILSDLMALNEDTPSSSRKPSLQCLTSHEPSSDDNRSTTSTSDSLSPSPKSPMRVSPKTNLNIQTNSLYDFDFYFDKPGPGSTTDPNNANNSSGNININIKTEGTEGSTMPPPAGQSSLSQRSSMRGGGESNAVVWSLNPNEDLAQALEFLMSATNSPAHSMQNTPNGNPNSSNPSSSGMRPPATATRNFSASLPPMPHSLGLGSSSRSPSSSQYLSKGMGMSVSADSPGGARIRPFSGNLASVASLLSRSNSGSCDQEMVFPLPAHSAPPPAGPAPGVGVGVGYNFHANINGASGSNSNGLKVQVPFARPEHSPMNHTHLSPACPDSKRPRSKNPATFSW